MPNSIDFHKRILLHIIPVRIIVLPCTEGIIKLLNQLNPNKASGPDNISARLFQEMSLELAPALAFIFQASLCQQSTPDDWHKANITPIYKPEKKHKGKVENYKPISLASISCRILEHIIHSNMMSYLYTNILSDVQHGFRKSRSCENSAYNASQ